MNNYNPLRMCLGKDGNMSLTRTFAFIAHLMFACTVAYLTLTRKDFLFEMWTLYITITVLHASTDKTMMLISNFKNKKLDVESSGAELSEGTHNESENPNQSGRGFATSRLP